MKKDRITAKYNELFSNRMLDATISKRLSKMEEDPDIDKLRELFCDKLLRKMTLGEFDHVDLKEKHRKELFQVYEENVKQLLPSCDFHWMAYSCYIEEEKSFYKYFNNIIKDLKQSGVKITEKYIVDTFIIPLKDAMPGFWIKAYRKLSPLCVDDATSKICKIMDTYFEAKTYEETIEPLLDYFRKYPEIVVVREFLAHAYEGEKKWEQEIAYLEGIRETETMFYSDCMEDYYFNLAWAYGKIKDYEKEEEFYRKSINKRKDTEWANNNLGWCLFKQRRYSEAEKIFYRCVSKGMDLPHSAYNYVRALIKEGKNKEAKAFTKSSEDITAPSFKKEVNELKNKNIDPDTTTGKGSSVGRSSSSGARGKSRRYQFSSEKALENEIVAKLKAGRPIFEKRLKIYQTKGEYGRQYAIKDGIIDILCEDKDTGDLYVIELKKDSGYKDAYDQTIKYMEWLSKSDEFKDRNVYGIICLNSPSKELIKKVKNNNKVSLYEYKIDISKKI